MRNVLHSSYRDLTPNSLCSPSSPTNVFTLLHTFSLLIASSVALLCFKNYLSPLPFRVHPASTFPTLVDVRSRSLLYLGVVYFSQHHQSSCEQPGHQRIWGAKFGCGIMLLLVVSAELGLGEDMAYLGDLRRFSGVLVRLGWCA
jgi:hypothetical protein